MEVLKLNWIKKGIRLRLVFRRKDDLDEWNRRIYRKNIWQYKTFWWIWKLVLGGKGVDALIWI